MRKRSQKTLIRKLDEVFSRYIRLRDADEHGYIRCISCGRIHHFSKMQNGHFINRKHMSTRFDEQNCNGQCIKCNMYDEGCNAGYEFGLKRKYGPQIINILYLRKHTYKKWDSFELEALIEHYKKEVKKLEYKLNN